MTIKLTQEAFDEDRGDLIQHSKTGRAKKFKVRLTYEKEMRLDQIFHEGELARLVPKNPTPEQVENAIIESCKVSIADSEPYEARPTTWDHLANLEEWAQETLQWDSEGTIEVTE